jgi:hypothetical protein
MCGNSHDVKAGRRPRFARSARLKPKISGERSGGVRKRSHGKAVEELALNVAGRGKTQRRTMRSRDGAPQVDVEDLGRCLRSVPSSLEELVHACTIQVVQKQSHHASK